MTNAISKELSERKDYLNTKVNTVYFGGGTPSLLTNEQLQKLVLRVHQEFEVCGNAEITLEANPEDLSVDKLAFLKDIGINRLSIGVQTFSDDRLKWMNRIHTASQAEQAVLFSRDAGFKNISLDLIYAVPKRGANGWENDMEKMIHLEPEHISLYGLTIEEKTVFGSRKSRGRLEEVVEEEAAKQYLTAISRLEKAEYRQYEVSNFARDGFKSRHNAAYWSGENYLGVGPGAHSFDGTTRQFNVRNNRTYISAIHQGSNYSEMEILSSTQQMNESILTQLRTTNGVDVMEFEKRFNKNLLNEFENILTILKEKGWVKISDRNFYLTSTGFLLADEIAVKLFFDE